MLVRCGTRNTITNLLPVETLLYRPESDPNYICGNEYHHCQFNSKRVLHRVARLCDCARNVRRIFHPIHSHEDGG